MDPISPVIQEIRRRIAVVQHLLESGNTINRDTALQLFESIEASTRNLLRLEGYIPSQTLDSRPTLGILQTQLHFLHTTTLNNRAGSFNIGSNSRGEINL